MAAGDDTLYLENLEEFVNDEDKIVTYKWLSRTLSVSANKAKQMLYAFVKAQQEERPDISHSITYVVGGRLDIEGNLVHKYVIVTDQDLEDTKKQFSPVTCVHIYSVQKCKPKDSNCLYTVDYDIIQEHKKDQNRWNHIQCKEAQCLSDRGTNRGGNRSSSFTTNAPSTSKMVNGTSERPGTSSKGGSNSAVDKKKPSNEKTRKGQMSALEMFAKKPNTSSEKREKEGNTVKTEGSSVVAKKTAAGSKPGSMKSFFGKAVTGSSAARTSEEKKENKKITPTKVENKDEKKVDRPKKSSKLPEEKEKEEEEEEDEEEPVPKKISKRMNRECDTEEEPVKLKKSQKKKDESQSEVNKRKTKKRRAFIHDSDEEPEEEMPAEKEQPKEKKSKKKRKRTKDLSAEENSHEEASSVSNSSGHLNENKTDATKESESSLANQQPRSNESTRRRKRRKVLRSKTSMNDEGYMVTEKVWESESTDASDEEQAREAATTAPSKAQAQAPQKSSRASTKLLSDAKTSKPGKQASLMNFFQKS